MDADADTVGVYGHSVWGLWRVQFEGSGLGCGREETGKVTLLIDYRKENNPLRMGFLKWNSQMLFFGGEELDQDNLVPDDKKFDWPRYLQSNHVYKLLALRSSKPYLSPLLAPSETNTNLANSNPNVVPIKTDGGSNTVFYVFGNGLMLAPFFCRADQGIQVFDSKQGSWSVLQKPPPYRGLPSFIRAAFELRGSIVLLIYGTYDFYELSFNLASQEWTPTSLFTNLSHYIPSSMISVHGLSDDIRIGCCEGCVMAYKFNTEGGETKVAIQNLDEVNNHTGPFWEVQYPAESVVCDIGNGEVLFISSSMEPVTPMIVEDGYQFRQELEEYPDDYTVHYYFLKFKLGAATGELAQQSFLTAQVLDCCHKIVEMKKAAYLIHNFAMLNAFTL